MTMGMSARRGGALLALREVVELPFEVDRLARPERGHHVEGLAEALHPHPRLGLADAEPVELLGHGPPADPEFESAARGMVEGHRLLGQDGWMPERVAQHEVAERERLGVGSQPGRRDHGIEHVVALGHGWGQVIHQRESGETGRLGRTGSLDHGLEAHAHLGQEEVELGGGVHRTSWVAGG